MKISLQIFFLLFLNTAPSFAAEVVMHGSAQHYIPLTHKNVEYPEEAKEIQALQYVLAAEFQEQAYQAIQRRLSQPQERRAQLNLDLPRKVQLGMANVPVLDQGMHNTCTTFAVTAALNAALERGDYLSQLCLLQLGNYLEHHKLGKSGWDGIDFNTILMRIERYGVMRIADQHHRGCGGSHLYPTYYFTPTLEMSPEEYRNHALFPLNQKIIWRFITKTQHNGVNQPDAKFVQKIKTALYAKQRVIISALMPRSDLGTMGATGTYHYRDDTWVLTQDIAQDVLHTKKISGHAMVITGYDDQATARDQAGILHKGLFKLRNSWSALVGDWGDFYMSYDYAEILVRAGVQIGVAS